MSIRMPPPLLPSLPTPSTNTDAAPKVAAPPPVPSSPPSPENNSLPSPPPALPSPEAQRVSRMRLEHDPAATMMQHRMGQLPDVGATQSPNETALGVTSGVHNFVREVLANESQAGPWTADDGMCLDLAAKWLQRLDQAGIPARLATVDPNRREEGTPVKKGMEGKFHAYVVAEQPGEDPLIIDPTWRQFISEPKQGTEGKPDVFVGTEAELLKVLQRHESNLQIEIVNDPLVGNRKTQDVLELGYGLGTHSSLRELHALKKS